MIQPGKDFRQISFDLSRQSRTLVTAEKASEDVRKADMDLMQTSLRSSCNVWPYEYNLRGSPHPIVVPKTNVSSLEIVHRLLSTAITDIVERWWTDPEARFPHRMPLEHHEEEVLRVCKIGPLS